MPFIDVSLSVSPNLKQSLQQYLATERIEGSPEEMYSCLGCQSKTNAKIKKKFLNMPKYLIIHIKRFEENGQTIQMNQKPIEYPLSMDLEDYCNQPWEGLGKFNLIGVVLHKGDTLEQGHYQVITKRLDGLWWHCNDAVIELVKKPELALNSKKTATLLLYQKDE